jgi:hypothetical protein
MEFSSSAIRPEQNGWRNWTMVSLILPSRLHYLTSQAHGFSTRSTKNRSCDGNFVLQSSLEGKGDTFVQLFCSFAGGLIATVRDIG